jgi:RNA polymerase sigma-70 factor (ECF subfamily)
MPPPESDDLSVFESYRSLLVAHAYRMLGDLGRAEDMTQEAWLRWDGRNRDVPVEAPRAYLVTIITRLCINELESAAVRREESRGDRLPEPVDLDERGLGRVDMLDRISMAFLVVLQRLTPAERAVLLLRDVFEFDYREIAGLIEKSEGACRKLLERARQHVAAERQLFSATPEAHARLLAAFSEAAGAGDLDRLLALLADDAVMVTDGGAHGRRVDGVRNLPVPLQGARRIAAFVAATARGSDLTREIHELNGQPAVVFYEHGKPFAALLLAIANERVHRVFFHADLTRLRFLGSARTAQSIAKQ